MKNWILLSITLLRNMINCTDARVCPLPFLHMVNYVFGLCGWMLDDFSSYKSKKKSTNNFKVNICWVTNWCAKIWFPAKPETRSFQNGTNKSIYPKVNTVWRHLHILHKKLIHIMSVFQLKSWKKRQKYRLSCHCGIFSSAEMKTGSFGIGICRIYVRWCHR